MLEILIQMLLRMTLIITIAFLITRLPIFRKMIYQKIGATGTLFLIVIFGVFGVIGNYTALVVEPGSHNVVSNLWNPTLNLNNAIIDTRNIGIITGGFFAGPIVGIGAALIAGFHRLLMGGFINVPIFWISILGGILSGWISYKWQDILFIKPWHMFFVSIIILTIQILFVPILAFDHQAALKLISVTGLPIIIINSIGIWICAMIFYNAIQEEERTRASQTIKTFTIANQTFSLFRSGINEKSTKDSIEIIKNLTNAEHISITRGLIELAFTGEKIGYKRNLNEELALKKTSIETNSTVINEPMVKWNLFKNYTNNASIIVPLSIENKSIGTITFYYRSLSQITTVEKEVLEGLGRLFSNQLELGEIERHNNLLQDAKIESLQAQLQPYFLFNALNTVVALCRIDPTLARELLIHLSTYLRNNINDIGSFVVPVYKEMENVQAYLAIEQARFPDRFIVNTDIDHILMDNMILPFIIQPLVENAINYGEFKKLNIVGNISITIKSKNENKMLIKVCDNGIGIHSSRIYELGNRVVKSSKSGSGTALFNIKERLIALYNQDVNFHIESCFRETCISITLPVKTRK